MRIPKRLLKRLYIVIAVVAATYITQKFDLATDQSVARNTQAIEQGDGSQVSAIEAAFRNRQSDVFLDVHGQVERILADDTRPPRHQRFIVALPSGRTVLVAHNTDLTDRIDDLREGTSITLHGEYEWNEKGGVVHWTHADPQGRHNGGWIDYNGRRYR